MAGLFLSSLHPSPFSLLSSPQPIPSKSEVSFLICTFFSFFFGLSPFEFQRKTATLMYHTGTGLDRWDGMGWDGMEGSFGTQSFLALLLSLRCSLSPVMFLHTFDAF